MASADESRVGKPDDKGGGGGEGRSGRGGLSLMALNDNKAGMEGLDKERINAIIQNASKGSKFYVKQQENQQRINGQIEGLQARLRALTEKELHTTRAEAGHYIEELKNSRDLSRTLVHVDMDMFYAAVEMRDNPDLRDKPMAVGGMGMLSTSNYAARKFGVRAAMPGFIGKKLCPDLILVPGDMKKYAAVSEVIRGVFREYDENFAPMSLDEAYMDITDYLDLHPATCPWDVVQELRAKIEERTRLTASAGIAPNTFLAKVCSDLNKPNGQYYLPPNEEEILEFVRKLPIRKASGVGNVSEQLLRSIGVSTCQELYEKRGEIKLLFSAVSFQHYMQISQGIGSSRLEPPEDRIRKSISTETTFKETDNRSTLLGICDELSSELSEDMKSKSILGQAVTIKIKSHNFITKTKVRQLPDASNDAGVIHGAAKQLLVNLLDTAEEQPLALRLMGVRMSDLKNACDSKQRQSSIVAFIKDSAAAKPKAKSSSSGLLRCPICTAEVQGLDNLNLHLDNNCDDLPKQSGAHGSADATTDTTPNCDTTSVIKQKEESIGNEKKRRRSTESLTEFTGSDINVDSDSQHGNSYQINSYTNENYIIESEKEKETAEDRDMFAESDEEREGVEDTEGGEGKENDSLLCPVCFQARFDDERLLNRHIDECLNQGEIRHLNSSRQPVHNKPDSQLLQSFHSSHSKSSKRMKLSTIDSYFQRS